MPNQSVMFSVDKVVELLQEPASFAAVLEPGWIDAMVKKPETLPVFLEQSSIAGAIEWTGLEHELQEPLYHLAVNCWREPHLQALLWYCVYQINDTASAQTYGNMPRLEKALGERAGLFYLLVALSVVPLAVARYRANGIDETVIRQTLREIRCFCDNHRVGNDGLPGLIFRQLNWLRNYRDGRLHRLGRLEYKINVARGFAMILRRNSDGVKVALAEDGQRFDRHGYIEYDNCPDEQSWTSTVTEDAAAIIGYPIHPGGYALNSPTTFPLDQWEIMVRFGDPTIDMHIPSGGGLTPEACADSFRQAGAFFSRRYPEMKLKIIWCASWIFNTQLEEALPASNLAAFQREQYLFPVKSSGNDGMFFVFCRDCDNLSVLPRETSLQRTMLGILDSGRKLRTTGMFFAVEDLGSYGTQHYRRTFSIVP